MTDTQKMVGIVGNGRLAKHLKHYFDLLGRSYQSWDRSSEQAFEEFSCEVDIILLAISDDAITPFIEKHSCLKNKTVFHFSGALTLEGINSCHPLMTFANELYSLGKYQAIPLVSEEGKARLSDCIDGLQNPELTISSELKAEYHAWCVMAGNFTTILWQEFHKMLEDKFNASEKMIFPYMDQLFQNMKSNLSDALTGPLARKDLTTINKNLNSITEPYKSVYSAFLKVKGINTEINNEDSL